MLPRAQISSTDTPFKIPIAPHPGTLTNKAPG
jgi:hypothetical protein